MDSSAYILTLMIMHTQCLPNTMHTYIHMFLHIYIYTYIWTRRAANVSISQHALEVDARTEKGEKKSGGQVSSE